MPHWWKGASIATPRSNLPGYMKFQMHTVVFLLEKHSLRKRPHAFGLDLMTKSETENACWKGLAYFCPVKLKSTSVSTKEYATRATVRAVKRR